MIDDPGDGSGDPGDPGSGGGGTGGDPGGYGEWVKQAINGYYQKYLGRAANPQEIQGWLDAHPNDLQAIESGISGSDEAKQYQSKQQGSGGGGGGGGGGMPGGGNITDPFNVPFNPPGNINLGGPKGIEYIPPVPGFTPPGYTPPKPFAFDPFKTPTPEEALNDPGYQFRTQQGANALQNWAAARGTLNDSGTGKALQDYGQNAASQEYSNVWNRVFGSWQGNRQSALDTYNTNYRTQLADPYQIAFQGAQASYMPQFAQWQAQGAAGQHQNDMNSMNAWNSWLQHWNIFRDQRDSTWDKTFQWATA